MSINSFSEVLHYAINYPYAIFVMTSTIFIFAYFINSKRVINNNNEKKKEITSCECCLIPFNKDPGQRTSDKYCSLCYKDGKLNAEGVSLKDFQAVCYQGMKERGMSSFMARIFTQYIAFAPYWNENKQKIK